MKRRSDVLRLLRARPGSRRDGLGGLAWEDLRPDVTIRYAAAGATPQLLHLLRRSARRCKCAISIHEGIYMHPGAASITRRRRTDAPHSPDVGPGRTNGTPSQTVLPGTEGEMSLGELKRPLAV